MKYLLAFIFITLTGCDSETKYGECVGLMDDKDPKLTYVYDKSNIFWAVLLSETLVVPVIVVLDRLQCPIHRRK